MGWCGGRSVVSAGPIKKALAASERDEEARTAWREAAAHLCHLDPAQFIFVDESGSNMTLTRLYGWAPHDQRATGSAPRNHGKNTTLLAALTPDGLHMPWLIEGLIEGAMDSATFAWHIRGTSVAHPWYIRGTSVAHP